MPPLVGSSSSEPVSLAGSVAWGESRQADEASFDTPADEMPDTAAALRSSIAASGAVRCVTAAPLPW